MTEDLVAKPKLYQREWFQTTLTTTVVCLCVIVVVILLWVNGIENGNRDIICKSRELREQYPPETALEAAQLENARKQAADCR